MHYQFPTITHIDQVRDVIKNVDEFIIAERDWGYVANYLVSGNHTFPEITSVDDAIRRECRGLIFDLDGNLISRPYHKFWNLGERTESLYENVDFSKSHIILEKLDGSMIRPLPIKNSFRMASKMGITDVSLQTEVWLSDYPNYESFMKKMISNGFTPIFEWCSRKQQIVISYPVDRLVLTALRHNTTGTYSTYNKMKEYADEYNLDLVKVYNGTANSMEELISETKDLQGQEGWVIRFDSGQMLKVKAEEYVIIHRAKENLLRENRVITMLIDEKSDDVKPFLLDEDRKKVEKYEESFWNGVSETASSWKKINQNLYQKYSRDQRKEFALGDANKIDPYLKTSVFKAWDSDPDNYDWRNVVLEIIKKNLSTGAKVDRIRYLWGGAKWNEVEE